MLYNINLTDKCNLKCKQCFTPKTAHNMSKEIIDKSVEFVCNRLKIDDKYGFVKIVEFMGGEVGLLDPDIINDIIDRIKENTRFNDIEFRLRTNLVYELTDKHIQLFKKVNTFGTSWDYKIRFANSSQEELWRKNLEIIKKEGIRTDCTICVTKTLIENYSPQDIIDFMLSLDIESYNLMTMAIPTTGNKDYDKPVNRIMDKWLYEVYLIYEKMNEYGQPLFIEFFDCIKDAFYKNHKYSDFQRNCQKVNMTIDPYGNVSQCLFTQHKPYYNLITKKLNENIYNDWVKFEKTFKEECKKCELFEYCNGNCCLLEWDESGCPSTKLIFKHLIEKSKNG